MVFNLKLQNKRVSHLDGLRGLAILMVISFHALSRWPEHLNFVQHTINIFPFKYGMHGVQLFFMISGYVIFMSLENCTNSRDFIIKRWSRLFPSMCICTIFIFLYSFLLHNRPAGDPNFVDAIPGLLFINPQLLSSIFGFNMNSLEGAFWTLYVEWAFYLFSCLLYFTLGRNRFKYILFLALPVYIIGSQFNSPSLNLAFTWIGLHSFGWFYIGCCVYEITNGNPKKTDYFLLFVSILLSLGSGYIVFKDNYSIINIFILLMLISIFILSFYVTQISSVLSTYLFVFFGFISYPLYLIHENLMVAISNKLISAYDVNSYISILTLTPSITVVIITSYLIAKFPEPYCINYLRNSLLK